MPCAICLCDYKDPRILPCGHSFCEECLKNAVINYKLICPSCRTKHKNIDLSLFPKNYGLIDEVEKKIRDELSSPRKTQSKKKKGKRRKRSSEEKIEAQKKINEDNNLAILEFQIDGERSKARAITKVHDLEARMAWFRLEGNIKRLVFTFVFLFVCLVFIT